MFLKFLARPLCLRNQSYIIKTLVEPQYKVNGFGIHGDGGEMKEWGKKSATATDSADNSGDASAIKTQWHLITAVLDRLCALVFFGVNLLAIVFLFPRPSSEWLDTK